MRIRDYIARIIGRAPRCSEDCFHAGMFGGENCCNIDGWGTIEEPVEIGDYCIHPESREIYDGPIVTVSLNDLCDILAGGENQLVEKASQKA